MSFPISAALLDAIVLSVVAQEPEGTYGYTHYPAGHPSRWSSANPPCTRCCGGSRRTSC